MSELASDPCADLLNHLGASAKRLGYSVVDAGKIGQRLDRNLLTRRTRERPKDDSGAFFIAGTEVRCRIGNRGPVFGLTIA